MRIQFNTGNLYGPDGQRIVAVQTDDGAIHFHDLTRGIDGYITDRTCLEGRDPGPAAVFERLDAVDIKTLVTKRYVNDYKFRSHSPIIGRKLRWIEKGD